MIKKEQLIVGNKIICSVLGLNGIILSKTDNDITVDTYTGGYLGISSIEACATCTIEIIDRSIKPVNRLDLISDPIKEAIVPKLEIQEQNSSIMDLSDTDNLTNESEILHALEQAKDFLHQKLKHKNQQVQAKKDLAASYREVINIVEEEIQALITRIDNLKDQLKIKKASK